MVLANCRGKIQSCFCPGDVVACVGDQEICSVSRRRLVNLGELAYMHPADSAVCFASTYSLDSNLYSL